MNQQIQRFSDREIAYGVTDAALAELRERWHLEAIENREDYNLAKAGIKECRELRGKVEAKRKELKADALEFGKMVDAEAKRITEALLEVESPLKELKTGEDQRKKAEKEARERAERERVEHIRNNIAAIRNAPAEAVGCTSEEIMGLLAVAEETEIGPEKFEEFAEEAQEARAAAVEQLERILAEKREQEEQAAELERLKAEREAEQAALDAERRKLEAERQAQEAELAAKRAEDEAKAAAEREKIEAEKAKIREAEEARERERIRAEERERAEREAKDAAAKEKAEQERLQREEEERQAREEAAKTEKERLLSWIDGVEGAIVNHCPPVENEKLYGIGCEALNDFVAVVKWARKAIGECRG